MAISDDDIPTIITSERTGDYMRDGISIDIQIYRLEEQDYWTLEVVDSEGGSTVWDDKFATDADAMDEVMRTIKDEGMKVFNPYYLRRGKRGNGKV